jgi:hypothetical protein
MRADLGLFLALVLLALGGILLHDGLSNADPAQVTSLMSGALFLSLGMTCTWLVLKNWWRWKKTQRHTQDGYR